jgi:hypothetical protein
MSDRYIAGIGPSDCKTSLMNHVQDLPQDKCQRSVSENSRPLAGRDQPGTHSNYLSRVNICGLREACNVFDGLGRLWSKALDPAVSW